MATSVRYARELDRVEGPVSLGEFDFSGLVGDWVNATGAPGGVTRLRLRADGGRLLIRAESDSDPWRGDWGEVPARLVFSDGPTSTKKVGYFAVFQSDTVRVELQAYAAFGLIVQHALYHFTDNSGREDYFAREFYFQGELAADGTLAEPVAGGQKAEDLVGTWLNVNPETRAISRIECTEEDGGLRLRAFGVGPEGPFDFGTTTTSMYTDSAGREGPVLTGTFEQDFMRLHVQPRILIGIVVMLQYAEFTDDSGRANHFMRECFRRV